MKTLTLSERNAGFFEKKVRLGDRRHPAAVETGGITAKLENGEPPFGAIVGGDLEIGVLISVCYIHGRRA